MLLSEPTKKGAGMRLWGRSDDLRNLHETVHALCAGGDGDHDDQESHVLSLAYEIRKAYEGARDQQPDPNGDGVFHGTKLLWPSLLFHVAYLRRRAGSRPTDKEVQANLYRLEHCVESALLSFDEKIGREVLTQCLWLGQVTPDYLFGYIDDVCYQYVYAGATGKMRFRQLPQLLRSMDERSAEYKAYETYLHAEAKKHKCSVHALHDRREWGEFEW